MCATPMHSLFGKVASVSPAICKGLKLILSCLELAPSEDTARHEQEALCFADMHDHSVS